MAITVDDEPSILCPVGQQLMAVASSTNVAEDGFKYKVTFQNIISGAENVLYVPPNIEAACIVDASKFLSLSNDEYPNGSVHSLVEGIQETNGVSLWRFVFLEAWLVAGVLTDDPDAEGAVATTNIFVWNGVFQASDGYKPSVDRFTLDGETKRWLSDRQWNTHSWQYAETFGFPTATNKVFIPCTESDWGVSNIVRGLGTATKLRYTIYASNGTPTSADLTISEPIAPWPVYPANVNQNIDGLPKPMDYAGWRCYTVQALDVSNNPVSVLYVFYNATLWGNTDCRYDRIRIAWKGFGGSWEYFNFTKKNEESIEIERKRYQQVLGTYGTSFTQNGMQRGLTEVGNITKRFLTINSDWISEGEFQLLRGMMVSRQVHWVQDDGTFIPMLVEDNTYTEQRTRDGKLKNLTVKLSYANNLWT